MLVRPAGVIRKCEQATVPESTQALRAALLLTFRNCSPLSTIRTRYRRSPRRPGPLASG
jgi:hypothetical protein